MTGFVVDAGVVLHLVAEDRKVPAGHLLLAPALLRSQTLSMLHEAVHRDEIPSDAAPARLARIRRMPIRLLGDAVLRRRAWEPADRLGWASTYDAEYVALPQLQGDALMTLDADPAGRVEGVVEVASIDDSLFVVGVSGRTGCGTGSGRPTPDQTGRRPMRTAAVTGRLLPGETVDGLADQVGMAVVPGVLLDHVDHDPPQAR